jgi:hypothetical protein
VSIPRLAAILTGIAGLCCGCSGAPDKWMENLPDTVPAEGVLLLDGKAVEGAAIVLSPNDPGGFAASAISGSSGRFRLQAFPTKEGAVPGSYRVVVTKNEPSGSGAWKPEDFGEDAAHAAASPPPSSMKNVLPARFADPKSSGVAVTIPPDGASDLTIDLNSKP